MSEQQMHHSEALDWIIALEAFIREHGLQVPTWSDVVRARDRPPVPDNVWCETVFHGSCVTCTERGRVSSICDWISCPTGGWWAHQAHPIDNHDATVGWSPPGRTER